MARMVFHFCSYGKVKSLRLNAEPIDPGQFRWVEGGAEPFR
jgi:hypothetical protein